MVIRRDTKGRFAKDPRRFARDIVGLAKDTVAQYQTRWKELAENVLRFAVMGTPVDTGHTRLGWYVSVGSSGTEDRTGGAAPEDVIASGLSMIQSAAFGQKIFIQNYRPAAPILEFGLFVPQNPGPSSDPRPGRKGRILVSQGFSTQAPRGMLADAAERARRIFDAS